MEPVIRAEILAEASFSQLLSGESMNPILVPHANTGSNKTYVFYRVGWQKVWEKKIWQKIHHSTFIKDIEEEKNREPLLKQETREETLHLFKRREEECFKLNKIQNRSKRYKFYLANSVKK